MRVGRRTTAAVAVGLVPVLSACESSQSRSARLRAQGATAAQVTTVKAGAKNAEVRVTGTTVLSSGGGTAVVVGLRNRGRADQVAVPVQFKAKDRKGSVVAKNDLRGLQTALQQMALVRGRSKAYWVDDQVTASKPAKSVTVAVGAARGKPAGAIPKVVLKKVKMNDDPTGKFLSGIVRNESKVPQVNMPIYAVVRRGGKVVAAGRALIERLKPEPQPKPTVFRIFFVGNPKRGTLTLQAVPTVLQPEGT